MASQRQLKTRIRSVSNTRQITRAMQMVAASKMRRAQDAVLAVHPYAETAIELLTHFANQGITEEHPLFAKREVKKRSVILIASDRGLAGAYNSNIIKQYVALLKDSQDTTGVQTIAIGRKATQFTSRLKDVELTGAYEDLPDQPTGNELRTIIDNMINAYEAGETDAVDIVFTRFESSLSQVVETRRLLPAGFVKSESVSDTVKEALYEPSPQAVLDGAVYRLIWAQLYQAMLDARASEHSMRMMAMKNATDNAGDLIEDLTLEMNKARQAAITQELSEITGGVEALGN